MSSCHDLDFESCYAAVKSRDPRYDGVFYTAVRSTGIYCRPSCPARTPAPGNVTFHPTAAAAQSAGFRACKRCLPDATPGSPQWNVAATTAGRAMQLISDGVVDRDGVGGLAARLGYSTRQLSRLLTTELGAGPLALARARRAQTARVLVETTDMALTDVAFAAGFSSVRQFNDTMREVYAATPTALRGRGRVESTSGAIELRLAVRTPFAGRALLKFLSTRAVAGVELAEAEETGAGWYARTLDLPHGPGAARLELDDHLEPGQVAMIRTQVWLHDQRDTGAAMTRLRRLLDADCDPVAVADHFAGDPTLGPLVRRRPGLRVPGHVAGAEVAVRAVLGQQVSVAGARTLAGRLVATHGEPVDLGIDGLTHLFPSSTSLSRIAPEDLPMPRSRGRALADLTEALATGEIDLDRGPARDDVRRQLLDLTGIGPWTADYISMRALGDPDVFLPTDVGVRHALERHGDVDPTTWAPWRSYALIHLWTSLEDPT